MVDVLTSAPKNVSLGKDANIVAKLKNSDYFRQWRLLAFSQKLLIEANIKTARTDKPHRTRLCHAVRAYNADAVTVNIPKDPKSQKASLSGVQTCGCIWSCPVCAKRIAQERGEELSFTITQMSRRGFVPIMITLTARHNRKMRLSEFKDKFKSSWRKCSQDGTYRRLKKMFKIEHTIKANEVTWTRQNGWHYHSHGLLFIPVDELNSIEPDELQRWIDALKKVWLRCLSENNLDGDWEHALNVKAHGDIKEMYLAKLGLEDETSNLNYELTSGHNKDYKGLNIWSILRRASEKSSNAEKYMRLYVEYVQAMTGDNWITYSHGLKDFVGLEDRNDEEIAEKQELDIFEPLVKLSDAQYMYVRKLRAYEDVLQHAAYTRNADKVLEFVGGLADIYHKRDYQRDIVRMETQLQVIKDGVLEAARGFKMYGGSYRKKKLDQLLLKQKTLSETLEQYRLGNMPF